MRKRMLFAFLLLVVILGVGAQKFKDVDIFEVSPNPMYRYTVVYLNINQATEVCIRVEDDRGNPVKTIFEGVCHKDSNFTWYRDLDDGSYAPDGIYHVIVSTDSRYTSTKKTLILK